MPFQPLSFDLSLGSPIFFILFPQIDWVLTSCTGGVACLRFGAGMLVPLQGPAVRVVCVLWSGHAGAAAGCRGRCC